MITTEPTTETLAGRIALANRTRRPDWLPRKYKAMRESPFRFFRATPYLFYEDWVADNAFGDHPLSWVCADLHLENLGSYRADNGLVYFDINDFDEALLAPCTVDLARLITSLFVAATDLHLSLADTRLLASHFAQTYCQTLLRGKPRSVERETAEGVLKRFLNQVAHRSRHELVELGTRGKGRHRRLHTDGRRIVALPEAEHTTVSTWLTYALPEHNGLRLLDVAHRVAGTSSLALNRYVALVETQTGKRKLVDIKAVRPSVAGPYWAASQVIWPDQATRIVTLQRRLQDVSPGRLSPLAGPGGESFVMRALQPQADRIDLTAKHIRKGDRLMTLLGTIAQLTASAHLRSGGQQGSAITDELIAFAADSSWMGDMLHRAEAYADRTRRYYGEFCRLSLRELTGTSGPEPAA